MYHANYKKWLQELIPNLESKSVIVVDNASYPKYRSTGAQPAMPEKVPFCSGWISMIYGTVPA
jgi:predicted O-methyltransferase YrrM